ncbi:MAG TPA: glycoside hydrolase family 20 zincin-like fold domain-containing protein [Anaerolineaceae bacterium]
MPDSFLFLPAPRRLTYLDGGYALPDDRLILLDGPEPQALRPAAARFEQALERLGLHWQQVASRAVPAEQVGLALRVAPERAPIPQGYRIHVSPAGILVEAHDAAGIFYGVCTLIQLLQQAGKTLPCLEITDWPDIAARGVMLDISRDKVYRMDYLYALVDRLAGWKINQLQLYTEHTFAYRNHSEVWQKASPMTAEEIMALDEYCRARFIELVPNQNSFGHMERWLTFPRYAPLAETHDWYTTPWGDLHMKGPFSLAPEVKGSFELISSLYDELLPNFTSRMLNVGCDETIDLGQGASREISQARGKGRVYLDFLLRIYADVTRRGYTMQFWGDILNNEHPDLVADLPRDLIALNWGYEANHPFDVEAGRCAGYGVPFYVCPGTSTWCSIAGRTDNALGNLLNAAENGIKYGTIGYLNTDWGDRGHWQVPPVSELGFVAGAAYSWALDANRGLDIPAVVSRFAFEDPSGAMGRVAYDLGNVYLTPGVKIGNGSLLFWALQTPLAEAAKYRVPQAALDATMDAINTAMAPLDSAPMGRADAALVRREFHNTARLLRHAVKRAALLNDGAHSAVRKELAADMDDIIREYRELWLARARQGGLVDSVARLETAAQDYQG